MYIGVAVMNSRFAQSFSRFQLEIEKELYVSLCQPGI